MAQSTPYFVADSRVPFDEDGTHEFKGHRSLAEEEVPPYTVLESGGLNSSGRVKRSRAPVSRALNGFLNTGIGGTVYCGIVDDGTVKGIQLTQFQKDHVKTSLHDLMGRFVPAVEEHRYKVTFVPVVPQNSPDEHLAGVLQREQGAGTAVDEANRRRPHEIRTYHYCWCDTDAVAQLNFGLIQDQYVIEITIKAWDPSDTRNKHAVGEMKMWPLTEDEMGNARFRVQAGLTEYTKQEMIEMTKQTVKEHYEAKLEALQAQLAALKATGDQ